MACTSDDIDHILSFHQVQSAGQGSRDRGGTTGDSRVWQEPLGTVECPRELTVMPASLPLARLSSQREPRATDNSCVPISPAQSRQINLMTYLHRRWVSGYV